MVPIGRGGCVSGSIMRLCAFFWQISLIYCGRMAGANSGMSLIMKALDQSVDTNLVTMASPQTTENC